MENKNKIIICVALFVVFIIVISSGLFKTSRHAPKTISQDEAYVASQALVKKQLKSPASAKFPPISQATIMKVKDSVYWVSAYVDAQNSFGALIRQEYSGTIAFEPTGLVTSNDLTIQ